MAEEIIKFRSMIWLVIGAALVFVAGASYVGGQILAGEMLAPATDRGLHNVPFSALENIDANGKPAKQFTSAYDDSMIEVIHSSSTVLYRETATFPTVPSNNISLTLIEQILVVLDVLEKLTSNAIVQG